MPFPCFSLGVKMNELEKLMGELEKRIIDLELKSSKLEDYLGVEWYNTPLRERYVEKGGRKVGVARGGE